VAALHHGLSRLRNRFHSLGLRCAILAFRLQQDRGNDRLAQVVEQACQVGGIGIRRARKHGHSLRELSHGPGMFHRTFTAAVTLGSRDSRVRRAEISTRTPRRFLAA